MSYDKNAAPTPQTLLGKRELNQNQVILQAKIRISQNGVEMLDFVIPLGMMNLHCSCPIPDEGTETAPLYVHMKPSRTMEPASGLRPATGPRFRGRRLGGEGASEEDESWGNRA